jgi:hypothetical protein
VQGTHSYLEEGAFPISVSATDTGSAHDSGGSTTGRSGTATVLEELLPDGARGNANQRWLTEVYRDLLHRQIDIGGLNNWNGLLNAGVSRNQIVRDIEVDGHHEYFRDVVEGLYQQYLQRAADAPGLSAAVNFLAAGGSADQLAASIIGSPEYFHIRSGASNSGFLNAVYADALGRAIDTSGSTCFGAALANGLTPGQAAGIILSSDEYHMDEVRADYVQFLDRAAEPAAVSSDAALLRQGMQHDQLQATIIVSDEFFGKTAN